VLWRFDSTGRHNKAIQISNKEAAISMYSAMNGLLYTNDNYYFAGNSAGFYTSLQKKEYTTALTNQDAYVYIYQIDHETSLNCLFEDEISRSDMSSISNLRSESSFYASSTDLLNFFSSNDDLRRTYLQNYFTPYISKYSGGFDLLDSMIIPKPCAARSANLTSVDYYRGQNAYQYKISVENPSGSVITQMDSKSEIVYQDGTSATDIARYDQNSYSVFIQTDDENKVGLQKLMIRNCDNLNRLLELNLYITVLTNTHPDFTSDVQTSWTMAVNDTVSYKMPGWSDPESNDVAQIYVDTMDG